MSKGVYEKFMKWASPTYKKNKENPPKPSPNTYYSTETRYENKALAEQVKRQAEQEVEEKYKKRKK